LCRVTPGWELHDGRVVRFAVGPDRAAVPAVANLRDIARD